MCKSVQAAASRLSPPYLILREKAGAYPETDRGMNQSGIDLVLFDKGPLTSSAAAFTDSSSGDGRLHGKKQL